MIASPSGSPAVFASMVRRLAKFVDYFALGAATVLFGAAFLAAVFFFAAVFFLAGFFAPFLRAGAALALAARAAISPTAKQSFLGATAAKGKFSMAAWGAWHPEIVREDWVLPISVRFRAANGWMIAAVTGSVVLSLCARPLSPGVTAERV